MKKNGKLEALKKRNFVADGWIQHYENLLKILEHISSENSMSNKDSYEFEEEYFKLCQYFDNIQTNPGLRAAFIEFAENQTFTFAALMHYYSKYGNDTSEIFKTGYQELIQNENEYENGELEYDD